MAQSQKSFPLRVIVVTCGVLWFVAALFTYFFVVLPNENRLDFYPRWVGARAILHRDNPYSAQVTEQIQLGMFGQVQPPDHDQHRFAYSALIAWLLLPFWLMPFPIAAGVWGGLAFLLLLILPIAVFNLLGWRAPPLALAIVLLFTILVFRYPINAYLLGQFIPFLLGCLVAAWWGLSRDKWLVVLLALVFATIRLEIIFLPLAALLVLAWERGWRRVVIAYGLVVAALWAWTTLWIGPWELDFYNGIRAYQTYAAPVWPPQLLNNLLLSILLIAAVVVWCGWMWFQVRAVEVKERTGWVLAVTTLTSLTIFPQTGNYTLVMALLAVWMIFWGYRRNYLYWIPLLVVLASPWFFFANFTLWERLVIPMALMLLLTHSWLLRKQNLAVDPLAEPVHV